MNLRRRMAVAALTSCLAWHASGQAHAQSMPPAGTPTVSNQSLADAVAGALKKNSHLKGYSAEIAVVDGVVELKGKAASEAQRQEIGSIIGAVPGVREVKLSMTAPAGVVPVQATSSSPIQDPAPVPPIQPMVPPAQQQPMPTQMPPMAWNPAMMQYYGHPAYMPPMPGMPPMRGMQPMQPMPFGLIPPMQGGHPGMYYPTAGQNFQAPLPMQVQPPAANPAPQANQQYFEPAPIGATQGAPNPQLQPPPLPPYAWPTYAPHNNYSRVAYPETYPTNAWPFIGPFYPFPKVPTGWRSVSLTWEDGYWWFGRNPTAHDWWRIRYR